MKTTAFDFDDLLDESVRVHGHLCAGQVLGVRMSMLGLSGIGLADPKGTDRKKLIVFVEMDRCATDAVQSVTGCSLGKRSMKFLDYGKMAATFLNLESGRAVRVLAREDSREKAKALFSEIKDKHLAQLEAYRVMDDEDLFDVMEVLVKINPEDMPGRPMGRVRCRRCGEYVQDMREVIRGGTVLCRPCSNGGYYVPRSAAYFSGPVVHKSHNGMAIRSKLWIEVDGEPVFGRGRRMLLEAIDRYGSINQAAKEINISYKKAWSYIKAMEERLGMKLVERHAGGKNGGGASITDEAREFLRKFGAIESGIKEFVDKRFEAIFGKDAEEAPHV